VCMVSEGAMWFYGLRTRWIVKFQLCGVIGPMRDRVTWDHPGYMLGKVIQLLVGF